MTTRKQQAQAFDDALAGRRVTAEARALVSTAEALCEAASLVDMDESFRLNLREQLMIQATTALAPSPAAAHPRAQADGFRRRVARLSAAVIVAAGGVGIVASSAQALPGDMLYPIKRGVESVELALHRSDESRGEYQLNQARERLAEATALAAADDTTRAAESLDDFRETAESGSGQLFSTYAGDGDAESVEKVTSFAAEAATELASLSKVLPTGDKDSLTQAANAIRQIVDQARLLCLECSAVELPTIIAAPTPAVAAPSVAPTPVANAPADTAPTPTTSSGPQVNNPAPGPTANSPLPIATPTTGTLPVVTPLIEGLLGNEDSEGLIPGLLDGLLGGGK